ncbi:LNS2 protein [Teladorsagia circumcincta]|uniref:LNS2 protein n=1 Tax=Teladorsagia circumcincta TaxID=45464 RepID=A0A2G9TXQ7_TELCI|nr:LNS2 protein [Teladorsagia circumcincta]
MRTGLPMHASEVTDWKWGQLPETRENKLKQEQSKAEDKLKPKGESSGWTWFPWGHRSSPAPAPPAEEGISLDELFSPDAASDPSKIAKYLGKAGSTAVSIDSGHASRGTSQPSSPTAQSDDGNFADKGTSWCSCNIYLYKWYERIVISDIDGTITKSDVLGHVIPAIGGTWAHAGVAELYTRIKNNGYKMVYLSSRAIGQSHTTKQYLKSIAQDSRQLPDGSGINDGYAKLARRYAKLFKDVLKTERVKISPAVGQTFCRKCKQVFVAQVERCELNFVQRKVIQRRCLLCGYARNYEWNTGYLSRNERHWREHGDLLQKDL